MNTRDVQAALNGHGFPCSVDGAAGPQTTAALKYFQQAYCGPGGWVAVDGVFGPRTQEALQWTAANNSLVTYFSIQEVDCNHCGCAYVTRESLGKLFKLREIVGRPLPIVAGYRCPVHNAQIKGAAPNSEHKNGRAFDIARSAHVTIAQARAAGFGGVGGPGGDLVTHVDDGPNRATFYDASVG